MEQQPACTLLEWLNIPCGDEKEELSFKKGIFYIDADIVREKMDTMENVFGATIKQLFLKVDAIPTYNKDTCFWAVVKYSIQHPSLPGGIVTIWGTASFFMGQYDGTWALAQVAETLATGKAFSKKWPQFGKDLNKEKVMKDFKAPAGKLKDKLSNTAKKLV